MCANSTKKRLLVSTPTVNTSGWFAAVAEPSRLRNPTPTIMGPKRLAGRRHQANRPVPMNDQPISSPMAIAAPRCGTWSDSAMTATLAAPLTRPARAIATSARCRPVTAAP